MPAPGAGTKGKWGRAHLAHPRYPWDQQLEDKLIFHRHLRKEEVHPVISTIHTIQALSDHIGKDETGLLGRRHPSYPSTTEEPGTCL